MDLAHPHLNRFRACFRSPVPHGCVTLVVLLHKIGFKELVIATYHVRSICHLSGTLSPARAALRLSAEKLSLAASIPIRLPVLHAVARHALIVVLLPLCLLLLQLLPLRLLRLERLLAEADHEGLIVHLPCALVFAATFTVALLVVLSQGNDEGTRLFVIDLVRLEHLLEDRVERDVLLVACLSPGHRHGLAITCFVAAVVLAQESFGGSCFRL